MDSDKQVVRVVLDELEETSATLEIQDGSGVRQSAPIPRDVKLLRRMGNLRKQFFFAKQRADGTWKLGAYAPWRDW